MKWMYLLGFLSFNIYAGVQPKDSGSIVAVCATEGADDEGEEIEEVIQDSGLQVNIYEDLLGALECPVCREYLEKIRVVPCCTQAFCRNCIHTWVEAHGTCPMCREAADVSEFQCNPQLERVVSEVPVECPGCQVGMKKGLLKSHMNSCAMVFKLPVVPGLDYFVKKLLSAKQNFEAYKSFLLAPSHEKAMTVRCHLTQVRNGTQWDLKLLEKPELILSAQRMSGGDFRIFVKKSELDHFAPFAEDENLTIATLKFQKSTGCAHLVLEGDAQGERGVFSMEKRVERGETPRAFIVAIPVVNNEEDQLRMSSISVADLRKETSKPHVAKSIVCVNKPPIWMADLNAYCLDFEGRVSVASVRNFLLVEPSDISKTCVLFGKVGENRYSLDFQTPFSPLQAIVSGISTFFQTRSECFHEGNE